MAVITSGIFCLWFLFYGIEERNIFRSRQNFRWGMRPASCKPNPDFPHPISKSPTRDHLRFPPSGVGGGGWGAFFPHSFSRPGLSNKLRPLVLITIVYFFFVLNRFPPSFDGVLGQKDQKWRRTSSPGGTPV